MEYFLIMADTDIPIAESRFDIWDIKQEREHKLPGRELLFFFMETPIRRLMIFYSNLSCWYRRKFKVLLHYMNLTPFLRKLF